MLDDHVEEAGSCVVEVWGEAAHKTHIIDSYFRVISRIDSYGSWVSTLLKDEEWCVVVVWVGLSYGIEDLQIVSYVVGSVRLDVIGAGWVDSGLGDDIGDVNHWLGGDCHSRGNQE